MRAALGGFLRMRGFDILEAASGEAALKELRSVKGGQVDAVVSDLEMPGLDGYGLIGALQTEKPELPVFAWTFQEDAAVAQRAVAAGARACINKLHREELMTALRDNGVSSKRGIDGGRAA